MQIRFGLKPEFGGGTIGGFFQPERAAAEFVKSRADRRRSNNVRRPNVRRHGRRPTRRCPGKSSARYFPCSSRASCTHRMSGFVAGKNSGHRFLSDRPSVPLPGQSPGRSHEGCSTSELESLPDPISRRKCASRADGRPGDEPEPASERAPEDALPTARSDRPKIRSSDAGLPIESRGWTKPHRDRSQCGAHRDQGPLPMSDTAEKRRPPTPRPPRSTASANVTATIATAVFRPVPARNSTSRGRVSKLMIFPWS